MSSTLALTIPADFVYVGAVLAGTFWLHIFQEINVSKFRKLSGIKYPYMIADKATMENNPNGARFNCAQRAHYNTIEQYPSLLSTLIISGLYHPKVAAFLGSFWLFGRVLYTIGYTTGDPAKRNSMGGVLHNIGGAGLGLLATWVTGSRIYALLK